jgi:hypothetical protein
MPRLGSKAAKVKLKQIGGSLFERWSVWINSTIRAKSYQHIKDPCLNCLVARNDRVLIGTAWLSSARVVECSINLLNERNLRSKYQLGNLLEKLTLLA